MERAPGAVRADPAPRAESWDAGDLEQLLDLARTFQRVGGPAMPEPGAFIGEVVAGLFGVRSDGAGGRFEIAPWLVPGWKSVALRRLRCHRTILDIRVRPRAEWVTVGIEVTFGPAIALALSLRNAGPVSRITVDEVALEGQRAIFTALGEHEVMFFLGGVAS